MYQSYISDDNILFVRHYGTFVGAETLTAILHALGSHVPNARLKGLYVDLRDVNDVSLEDTDGAFGDYFRRRLASYGQDFRSMCIVRVIEAESMEVNEAFSERTRRLQRGFPNVKNLQNVNSVADAKKALGLSVDYSIEYPLEK